MEMTPEQVKAQRIVCAAVRGPHGFVVTGARHFDQSMRKLLNRAKLQNETPVMYAKEQGFIDQFNNFLSREDAYEIADRQGQIIRECGNKGQRVLYSEHLY